MCIRDRISSCIKKHSKANNEYIKETYNPNYPKTFLTYFNLSRHFISVSYTHLDVYKRQLLP